MIVWFPDECIIRLMGRDCFKALNPEAHERARDNYDAEQKRERDTNFLLSRIPVLSKVLKVLDDAIKIAIAAERFHYELHQKLSVLPLDLWPYVKGMEN